jgi:hypothetical protein
MKYFVCPCSDKDIPRISNKFTELGLRFIKRHKGVIGVAISVHYQFATFFDYNGDPHEDIVVTEEELYTAIKLMLC